MKKRNLIYILLITVSCAALAFALFAFGPANDAAVDKNERFPIVVSEILASNSSYPGPDDSHCDYIEFYNRSDEDFDLSGYGITDSGKYVKHIFPEGTMLPANSYYVLYCNANSSDAGHAKFNISKNESETIYFIDRDGNVIQYANTMVMKSDQSMIYDSVSGWILCDYPSPGYENTLSGNAAWLASIDLEADTVIFNEMLASNDVHFNKDGIACDWIEFYNTAAYPVYLDGYAVCDDNGKELYIFPENTIINAHDYLLLYCSKSTLGDMYADFGISKDSPETFVLRSPNGITITSAASVVCPEDISCGFDSSNTWTELAYVTPGYENTAAGYSQYLTALNYISCNVKITEIMADNQSTITDGIGRFSDWIELTNMGEEACDLSGWYLSDDDDVFKWCIPQLKLAAGESIILFCADAPEDDPDHLYTGFSLSSYGETVLLSSPLGAVFDSITYPQSEKDRSYALSTNSGEWSYTVYPTPSFTNTADGYLAYCDTRTATGPLIISELQTYNDTYFRYSYRTYYDWVEIQNISTADINLSDYYISDNCEERTMCQLPDVVIAPGEFYTLLCPGDDSLTNEKYYCTSFAINAMEDSIYIFDCNGTPIDYAFIYDVPKGYSFGRLSQAGGFGQFEKATPGEANNSGTYMTSQEPFATIPGGIYDNIDGLDIELVGGGNIYYTLDGDIPTTESSLYNEPIHISETTVIRAICVEEGMLESTVMTESYFVNEGHTLPIVSLVSPHNGLFSGATGIYVGGNSGVNYYFDWEREANVALYEHDSAGSTFEIDCGLKMFGSGSREYCDKKSFKLLFKNHYEGPLQYDIFQDGDATVFSSLVLRAGEDYRFGLIRDDVCGTLARQTGDSLLVQNTRSVILYINGEYWGIYSIKEQFSQEYYSTYFNVPPETVTVERAPLTAGEMLEFINYATAHYDLSSDEGFEYICEHIDIMSLIDWMIMQAYAGNTDISVNLRYARSTEGDGLWRWCYYDLDWTLYVGANFNEVMHNGMQYSALSRRLIKNEQFQKLFCERLAELCRTVLSPGNVNSVIDYYVELVTPEIERERDRWNLSMWTWESNISRIRGLVNDRDRCGELIDSIIFYMDLTDAEAEEYFGDLLD